MRRFDVITLMTVLIINIRIVCYLRLAGLFYLATLLQIQRVHSFGSYYMSLDRYMQLEDDSVNSLRVSKELCMTEDVIFYSWYL